MRSNRSRWDEVGFVSALAITVSTILFFPIKSWAISAFARPSGFQVGACRSAFPALNDLGENFGSRATAGMQGRS